MSYNIPNIKTLIKQPYGILTISHHPNNYTITEEIVTIFGDHIMKKLSSKVKTTFTSNYTNSIYIKDFNDLVRIYLNKENYKITQKLFDHIIKVFTICQDNNITISNLNLDNTNDMLRIFKQNDELSTFNNIISLFKINTNNKDTMLRKIIKKFKKKTDIIFSEDDVSLVIKYNDVMNGYSTARTLLVLLPYCNNITNKLLSDVFDRIHDILKVLHVNSSKYSVNILGYIIPCLNDYVNIIDCQFDKNIYDRYNHLINDIITTYLYGNKFKQGMIQYNQKIISNNTYQFTIDNMYELLQQNQGINVTNAVNCIMDKYNIIPDEKCLAISCKNNPEILVTLNNYSKITNDQIIALLEMFNNSMKKYNIGSFDVNSYIKVLKLPIINKILPTFEIIDLILNSHVSMLYDVITEYVKNGYNLTQKEFNYIISRMILVSEFDSFGFLTYVLINKQQTLKLEKEMLHFNEKDRMQTSININTFQYICTNIQITQKELYMIFFKNILSSVLEPIIIKNNLSLDVICLRNACTVNKSIIIDYLLMHEIVPDIECVDNICKTIGNTRYIIKWIEKDLIQISLQNLKDIVSNMDQREMKPKIMKLLIEKTFNY